jgi:hypothetical protein
MRLAADEAAAAKKREADRKKRAKDAKVAEERAKGVAEGKKRGTSRTVRGAIMIGGAVSAGAKTVGKIAEGIEIDTSAFGEVKKAPAKRRKTPTKRKKTTKRKKSPGKRKIDPMDDFSFGI